MYLYVSAFNIMYEKMRKKQLENETEKKNVHSIV